jgi:hypothetical protein
VLTWLFEIDYKNNFGKKTSWYGRVVENVVNVVSNLMAVGSSSFEDKRFVFEDSDEVRGSDERRFINIEGVGLL